MTLFRLILRSLGYFRGSLAAVTAGMALATAVLTGALMVGDSVRQSLRDMALARLGPIHGVIAVPPGRPWFEASLAQRLQNASGVRCWPGISVRGRVADDAGTQTAAGIQFIAADALVPVPPGGALANPAARAALDVPASDWVASIPVISDTPLAAVMARPGRSDAVGALRLRVAPLLDTVSMPSMFDLHGSQRAPRNIWTPLADLQHATGQSGRANLLLCAEGDPALIQRALRASLTLSDCGLDIVPPTSGGEATLRSRSGYVSPEVEAAADRAARSLGVEPRKMFVNLIVTVRLAGRAVGPALEPAASQEIPRSLHYVLAAGVTPLPGGDLASEQVGLNAWAMKRLGAQVGDTVRLQVLERQPDGTLREGDFGPRLKIAAVLPMEGIGADSSLTPEYKGFTDAKSVHEWTPPDGFPFDRERVSDEDEAYWQQYRAAPQIFLNLHTAQRLWGEAYGHLTSIRVPAGQAEAFAAALRRELRPEDLGLVYRDVRAEQVAAAEGGTDFSMLFLAFSFFLIVAALLLVVQLFRLNLEQRGTQLALLAAVGFSPARLWRMMLAEGGLLAIAGSMAGSLLAVGYTALILWGLRTWWLPATGTTQLHLAVRPATLGIGATASLLMALAAVLWGLRTLHPHSVAALLHGHPPEEMRGRTRSRRWRIAIGGAVVLAAGLWTADLTGYLPSEVAFLLVGWLLLLAALGGIRVLLTPGKSSRGAFSLLQLAWANASRQRLRSLLTVALVALAVFILTTVGAMRQDAQTIGLGGGGFSLLVTTDIPLPSDLQTPAARRLAGITRPEDPLWSQVRFTALRVAPGQDASCLNMTRPTRPEVIGIPASLAGRFAEESRDPLPQLFAPRKQGEAIPAVADAETAHYQLKVATGGTLNLSDEQAASRTLRLCGTLPASIFQSGLLISDADFAVLFPHCTGFQQLLVEIREEADVRAVRQPLQRDLEEYGAVVETPQERMAMYAAVANTYLSTFQLLGALGLVLGTAGVAVVLLRQVLERQAELALLTAVGFSRKRVFGLLFLENGLLLALGLGVGSLAAILALPASRPIALVHLLLTLGATALFGAGTLFLAIRGATSRLTPSMLRRE